MFRRCPASKAFVEHRQLARLPRPDLGMLLAGIIAQAQPGTGGGRRSSIRCLHFFASASTRHPGCSSTSRRDLAPLARHDPDSPRRRYLYGEFTGKPDAIAMADSSTRKLIALQAPQGEWPWFFDARGTVLDYYEVYSCIVRHGASLPYMRSSTASGGARGADQGFVGARRNQLRRPMVPDLRLSIRSQVRGRTAYREAAHAALTNAHRPRRAVVRGPRRSPRMPELRTRLDPVVVRPPHRPRAADPRSGVRRAGRARTAPRAVRRTAAKRSSRDSRPPSRSAAAGRASSLRGGHGSRSAP